MTGKRPLDCAQTERFCTVSSFNSYYGALCTLSAAFCMIFHTTHSPAPLFTRTLYDLSYISRSNRPHNKRFVRFFIRSRILRTISEALNTIFRTTRNPAPCVPSQHALCTVFIQRIRLRLRSHALCTVFHTTFMRLLLARALAGDFSNSDANRISDNGR